MKSQADCTEEQASPQLSLQAYIISTNISCAGLQIFFNWWAEVTHGAKNGGSFSEMIGPGT